MHACPRDNKQLQPGLAQRPSLHHDQVVGVYVAVYVGASLAFQFPWKVNKYSETEFKGDIVRSEKATEKNNTKLGGMFARLKGGNVTEHAGSIDQRVAKLEDGIDELNGRIDKLKEDIAGIIIAFAVIAATSYIVLLVSTRG